MIKATIMIPTYNERESIEKILIGISELYIPGVTFEVLVIDDNSPDLTADFVDSLNLKFVKVLRREKKEGLGKAYLGAIQHLLAHSNSSHLVSMDADGSHRVKDLEKLLIAARDHENASLILGSRWIKGGSIVNWPKYRMLLSRAGTSYSKFALKLNISDLTGGFKIYSRWAIERIALDKVTSNGYCFQIEMAHAFSQLNAPIIEIPITFVERELGASKMSQRIVIEAMLQVTRWGLGLRINPTADKLHYVK